MSGAAAATPRLVLDERRLQANVEAMAARVRELGGVLRPHVKTHKSPEIMRRQLEAGAAGITTATIHEAEVMVEAGARDVLLAYPPVGEHRLDGLARLSERARIVVSCSEESHVRALAARGLAVEYYWEVDSGAGRLGTAPGRPTAELLARVQEVDGPRLAGLMTFAGHAYAAVEPDARRAVEEQERDALLRSAEELARLGIEPGVLSVGSTPLASTETGFATEYRFGNYVFNDATQVALGAATAEECALTVLSTVVGRPAPGRVILDAGSKALAAERMSTATPGFGLAVGRPDLRVERLYEEHAICAAGGRSEALRVGDTVELVPNHACTCANLHASYLVRLRDGTLAEWPVAARGWGLD